MANISSPLGALTLTTKAAADITAGTDVVVGFDARETTHDFNPGQFLGFYNDSGPQTGDAPGVWLPVVSSMNQAMADNQGVSVGGPITLRLSAPPKLAGYYSSPLVFALAPDDFVIVATGTF